MKHIAQALACLSFIFAIQTPCEARLSKKQKRTALYALVGSGIVLVAAAVGGRYVYSADSRKPSRTLLEDAQPLPQDRDGKGNQFVTPRRPRDTSDSELDTSDSELDTSDSELDTSDSELDTVSTDDTRLYLSPSTSSPRTITPGSTLSYLTPKALSEHAPYFTPRRPTDTSSHDPALLPESARTPAKERAKRWTRVYINKANAARRQGYTVHLVSGVVVSGSYGAPGMPAVNIGTTPDTRPRIPRTTALTPGTKHRLKQKKPNSDRRKRT